MRLADRLRLRIRSLVRKDRVEQELDRELAFHLDELTRENVEKGMSPEEARYAARRMMGGVAQFEEECRDARRVGWIESTVRDLGYALRVLRRSPGFTATAVACLALGIGATSAMFSVVDAVFFRPLPFAKPDRLAAIWEDTPILGMRYSPPAVANYIDWRAQNRTFEEMGAIDQYRVFRITGRGEPEQLDGGIVSAGLFRVLGVNPVRGRLFREEEDRPGCPKVAIITYRLWQRRFAGSDDAIGATIPVDGSKFTVVGIMPESFRFPNAETQMWSSFGSEYSAADLANRGRHDWFVVGRLKPGVSLAQANADVRGIAARLEKMYPESNRTIGAFASPLREHMVGAESRKLFGVLFAAVSFVLLIACANVANLMLSRAFARGKEVAIRISLGAGTLRVARQLIAEHLLLAAAGGAVGIAAAAWTVGFLRHLVPDEIASMSPPTLDWRVALFSLAMTAAACVLFSLAPAAQALRTDIHEALKQGSDRAGHSRGSQALRRALVTAEVAMAVLLLIGAGLMIRTFARLRGIDPGFRAENVLTMKTAVWGRFQKPEQMVHYYDEVLRRVTALPGVVSAGFTTGVPLDFKGWFTEATAEGSTDARTVNYRCITPDYLRTMGIPLHRGRAFTEADTASSPRVALVNETFARMLWPNRDAIGRRFGGHDQWTTVVGVVGDVKQSGLDVPPKPEFYMNYRQEQTAPQALAIRTAVEPLSLASAVRREIRAADRDQPITDVQTMEDVLDHELFQRRLQMSVLAFFGGSALLLASIGIYGVLAYLVTQRRREIGLRMALGAGCADILRNILGQGAMLIGAGLAIGLLLSVVLTRLMAHLLFGVTATDPATFVGVPVVLVGVGLAASYFPARRAMNVDPALTLRDE